MKQNVSGYWVPLTLAVLTAIGGHFYSMPVVMAENIEFTKGISGQKNNDKFLSQKGVKITEETEEDDKGDEYTVGTTYDFGGKDYLFRVENRDGIETTGETGRFVLNNIDSSGKKGTLHIHQKNTNVNDFANVFGINGMSGQSTVINSNLNITAYSAYASIGITGGNGTDIVINGNVKMRTDDPKNPWGITTRNLHGNFGLGGYLHGLNEGALGGHNGADYAGARWHPSGIGFFGGGSARANITITGDLDIAVRGTAVQTGTYSAVGGVHPYDLSTVSLIGPSVRIETPINQKSPDGDFYESFYSMASYGGTVNVGVKDSESKEEKIKSAQFEKIDETLTEEEKQKWWEQKFAEKKEEKFKHLQPTGGKTNIVGNAIVLKRSKRTTHPDTYQDGRVNVGLTTKDSSWHGVVDNAGADHAGELNVWLSNGAQWIHEPTSPTNGMDSGHMPLYSKPDYDLFDGVSYVSHLSGGISEKSSGFITQKSNIKIHIANYSGYNTIIYPHEGDGTEKAHYTGGDTTIVHAVSGSGITLATGNEGIDVTNEDQVTKVFQSLAQKLTYQNYVEHKNAQGENIRESNLTGRLVIASGLTASSVIESVHGWITFDKKTGVGGYIKPQEGEQTENVIKKGITGDESKDQYYKKASILKSTGKYKFTSGASTIEVENGIAVNAEKNVTIDASKGTLTLKAKQGIVTEGNEINVTAGNLQIGIDKVEVEQGIIAKGGKVTVKGITDIAAKKEAIIAENHGKVTIGNGTLIGDIISDSGEVAVNQEERSASVKGNIKVGHEGVVNITVKGLNKSFIGDITKQINGDPTVEKDGTVKLKVLDKARWEGAVKDTNAEIHLTLSGGQWKNTGIGDTTIQTLQGDKEIIKNIRWMSPSTKENKEISIHGFIRMGEKSGKLRIQDYNGTHIINYAHKNDGTKVEDYQGGNAYVKKAQKGSMIIAATDTKGMKTSNKEVIEKAFSALAKKIYYENAGKDTNLTGKVLLASGLTASSTARWIGDMTFDKTKNGEGVYTSKSAVNISGDFETAIMKGVRASMTDILMSWRTNANDFIYRAEALRNYMQKEGLWAQIYGGEDRYAENGIEFKTAYSGIKIGYDKVYPARVIAGIAIDYQKGNADYIYNDDDFGTVKGSTGKTKLYSIGVYGSRDLGNNDHWDLTLKAGNISSKYSVYNGIGMGLKGDYNNRAYAISTKYGKKFGDEKNYIEPQIQMTWASMSAKDYVGHAKEELKIGQGHFDSIVGRMGVTFGKKNASFGIHGNIHVAHEFNGGVLGTYYADDGGEKTSKISMKDTWVEAGIGANIYVGKTGTANLGVTKTFGGKYKQDWKINGTVRFEIGQGVASGSHAYGVTGVSNKTENQEMVSRSEVEQGVQNTSVEKKDKIVRQEKVIPTVITKTTTVEKTVRTNPDVEVSYGTPEGSYVNEAGKTVYTLGQVIVTARRIEQPIIEAKTDISVVTRKEIEEAHMTSVEDVLRTVPGTQFLDYGANGINANLSGIRINGSNDVLLLVDGVRVSAFQGMNNSGYMYSSMLKNMDNIERIEVLRGAAAVVYGSDAKGGVINIITRKITHNRTDIDIAKGNFGKEEARLSTQGRRGKISYHVNYDKFIDGNMKDGAGKLWEGHSNSRNIGAKLGYDINNSQKIIVNYEESETKYRGRDYIYGDHKVGAPYYGSYETELKSISHEWKMGNHRINKFTYRETKNESLYVKPQGEGNNSGKDTAKTDGMMNSQYVASHLHTYTFVTDQLQYKIGKHNIVAGVEFMKGEGSNYNSGTTLNLSGKWVKNMSFFIQDEWKFLPKITVTYGVRYDRPSSSSKSGGLPTNTARSYKISYDITSKDSIYAFKNDFFILPSMSQLFDPKYGNEALLPSVGNTTSIGYNHAFSDTNYIMINWFNTKTDVGITYVEKKDDKGNQVYNKDGTKAFERMNYVNGKSTGWNAQYATKIGENWEARIGWAHLNYDEPDNFALGYAPKDKATFALYFNKDKWSVAFDGFYFIRDTSHIDPNKPKGWPDDKYAVCNLALNYRPTRGTEFYFRMNNVFNKLWAEHTDTIWGNSEPDAWYSMPGRNFLLGMKHSF